MNSADISAALKTLDYFDAKVERLSELRFTKFVTTASLVTPPLDEDPFEYLRRETPDDESIDAFVLTMRLFVQNNEPISIRNIDALLQTLPISDELKAHSAEARADLNAVLDSYTPLRVKGEHLTYRRVFDVYFYGWLAHGGNEAKREEYMAWRAVPRIYGWTKVLFLMTLADTLEYLFWLRRLTGQVRAALLAAV